MLGKRPDVMKRILVIAALVIGSGAIQAQQTTSQTSGSAQPAPAKAESASPGEKQKRAPSEENRPEQAPPGDNAAPSAAERSAAQAPETQPQSSAPGQGRPAARQQGAGAANPEKQLQNALAKVAQGGEESAGQELRRAVLIMAPDAPLLRVEEFSAHLASVLPGSNPSEETLQQLASTMAVLLSKKDQSGQPAELGQGQDGLRALRDSLNSAGITERDANTIVLGIQMLALKPPGTVETQPVDTQQGAAPGAETASEIEVTPSTTP